MSFKHRVVALRHIADYLLTRGLTPGDLLQTLGMPAIALVDDEAWLDRDHVLQLGVEIERQTGDSVAGFHVAEHDEIHSLGPWGRAVAGAATLREALSAAANHVALLETGTRILLIPDGCNARLSIEFVGPLSTDPSQLLYARLLILRKVLDLAAEPIAAQVHVPHQPIQAGELERLLGSDLSFQADKPTLIFDRDALTLPLQRTLGPANPDAATNPPTVMVRQVMRAIEHIIEVERPTAKNVAVVLCVHLRTMQRHLAAWGVSFEELLDQYRHRIAMTYLTSSRHSITEIAFRLGYSDSAHFTRAFRRWTGASPHQIRAAPALRIVNAPSQGGHRLKVSPSDMILPPAGHVAAPLQVGTMV